MTIILSGLSPECTEWSGRRDLNPRPSAPKADALANCATPRHRKADLLLLLTSGFFILQRNKLGGLE